MTDEYPTRQQAILNIQRYLRQISYTDDRIPAPVLSGTWDPVTEESLASFQKIHGLPQTGRADEVTWKLLYEEYRRSVRKKSPPLSVPVFPRLPEGYEIGMGETSFAVLIIQWLLREITVHYDNLPDVTPTGIFDEPTSKAVTEFQTRNLIPKTGRVDKDTWDYLVEAYILIFEEYVQ